MLRLRCTSNVPAGEEAAASEFSADPDNGEATVAWRVRRLVVSERPEDEPDMLPASAQLHDPAEVKEALASLLKGAAKEGSTTVAPTSTPR